MMMPRIGWAVMMLSVAALAEGPDQADRYLFSASDMSRNQSVDEAVVDQVNQFSSSSEQIDYLNGLARSASGNRQKSTALRLLGETRSTNAIAVLLENLAFREEDGKTFPAVRALVSIGEEAVDPIFVHIQTTTNHVEAVRGAEAIQMIKSRGADYSEYFEWLKPRWDGLPKHLQIALGVIAR